MQGPLDTLSTLAGVQTFTGSPINAIVQEPDTASSTDEPLLPSSTPSSSLSTPFKGSAMSPTATDQTMPTTRESNSEICYAAQKIPVQLHQSSSALLSPPSQPGHSLTPLVSKSRSISPARHIPPPPKVGEKMQPASYYSPIPTPTQAVQPTYQMNSKMISGSRAAMDIYSPSPAHIKPDDTQSPYPDGSPSPQESSKPTLQTPRTAGLARQSFEHPPGYVQNPYAVDLTPEQRNGIGGSKSPTSVFGVPSDTVSSDASDAGILNGNGRDNDRNLLDVASGWLKVAGKKMSEVEGEVWRRINGD